MRKECADSLLEIGFDGFGYGGWPLDGEGNLLTEWSAYPRADAGPLPDARPGRRPSQNVLACFELGYGMFDSAMPTRDARHGRLYSFQKLTGRAGVRVDRQLAVLCLH